MISFVCSSQNPEESFKEHVIKTCGLPINKIEFLFYENNNKYSLTEVYNMGMKKAKYDTIVFLHHDMEIETSNFGSKILKHFEKNPEFGILGLAGTRNFIDPMWWKKSMMGIVNHQSNGKKWESKYSDNQGDYIAEVVVLDGVMLIVRRDRIKKDFDEKFQNFDFYDVSFCFANYLEGVKIGVITNIRITHFSVGAGVNNQNWKNNRDLFETIYKDKLPVNIKRIFRKGEKLKVLIGCLNFNSYDDSELCVLELAKRLVKQGCDVTVCSNIGKPLETLAKQHGIKTMFITEPPGYKLGDGKWLLKTENGDIPSQENTLYRIADIKFDVMHLSHKPVAEHLLRLYPNVPAIYSINDINNVLEEPISSANIKKYLVNDLNVKNITINKFGIDSNLIEIITMDEIINKYKSIIN